MRYAAVLELFAEGDEAEHEESRSLVEEIRREHEQVRVRFQVISGYEERLARVERTAQRAAGAERPGVL